MLITMSTKELERIKILQDVIDRRMRQCDAAKRLNISPRQVRRLIKQLEQNGPASRAHKARGKPSNRGHSPEYRLTVLQTIRETILTSHLPSLERSYWSVTT